MSNKLYMQISYNQLMRL